MDIENEVKETTEGVAEDTQTNDDIDTSWIDSYSDKDIDNTEPEITETNDKRDRDRDRDTETTVKEETYSPFDTSYFDNSYDTAPETQQTQNVTTSNDDTPYVFSDSYVDEANKNMKKWKQMAEENARTGNELAYTNAEVKKQEADALDKAFNKSQESPGIFSDPLGALKNIGNLPLSIPRRIASGFDGGAEIEKEFKGLNRKQQIEKIARNLAENPDYDVEKVLNVLGNNVRLSQTVDAIKDLAKTYEFTNKKRADIAANGETNRTGISAESERQIINDKLDGAKEALMNAYESGDPKAIETARQNYERVAERVKGEFPNSAVAEREFNYVSNPEVFFDKMKESYPEGAAAYEASTNPTPATPTRPATPATVTTAPAAPATPTTEEPATPVTTPTEEEPTIEALTRDQADYQRMKAQGWDADRMIRDPNTGKLLREPEVDRDKYTPSSTTTQEEGRDSNTIPHNEELNNFLPIEIINTNPENIEGVAEALDNGDTETAEYLLSNSLSANNFLQILDKVSLGGQSISPELLAVIQSMWDKLLAGQSVGKVNASDLSNLGRENRDAINKALQSYSEADLKDLGYYSRDTSATNESDYNKGLVENTNEVVSDVVKKYIIANPWILQAVSKWSK